MALKNKKDSNPTDLAYLLHVADAEPEVERGWLMPPKPPRVSPAKQDWSPDCLLPTRTLSRVRHWYLAARAHKSKPETTQKDRPSWPGPPPSWGVCEDEISGLSLRVSKNSVRFLTKNWVSVYPSRKKHTFLILLFFFSLTLFTQMFDFYQPPAWGFKRAPNPGKEWHQPPVACALRVTAEEGNLVRTTDWDLM